MSSDSEDEVYTASQEAGSASGSGEREGEGEGGERGGRERGRSEGGDNPLYHIDSDTHMQPEATTTHCTPEDNCLHAPRDLTSENTPTSANTLSVRAPDGRTRASSLRGGGDAEVEYRQHRSRSQPPEHTDQISRHEGEVGHERPPHPCSIPIKTQIGTCVCLSVEVYICML